MHKELARLQVKRQDVVFPDSGRLMSSPTQKTNSHDLFRYRYLCVKN